MKGLKRILLAIALLLTTAGAAQAFEPQGRFGLGYDADLNGVNFRYFVSNLGMDFTYGFRLQTAEADGQDADFDMIFMPKLVYAFRVHDKVNLNVFGAMFLEIIGAATADTDMGLGFLGGFAPEVVLWDHLAVEVSFGLAVTMNNLLEKQAQKLNVSIGTLGKELSVVSGALFRYYF